VPEKGEDAWAGEGPHAAAQWWLALRPRAHALMLLELKWNELSKLNISKKN